MGIIHEPIEEITYIIKGKYASIINDILTEEQHKWQWIGEMMAHAFDGTYYLNKSGWLNERLEEFTLKENGDLEIKLCYYDMDNAFPKFLLWKFPDIEIKMYDIARSDTWWKSCIETNVTTNDFDGAENMGLTSERYYMNLVNKFYELEPNNIKYQDGIYFLKDDFNEHWVPLKEYFHYDFKVIELMRPSYPPIKINLLENNNS